MSIWLLVLGLILFITLVVIHELGHYIVAKRNGVIVEEFGIGFPPRLISKRLPADLTLWQVIKRFWFFGGHGQAKTTAKNYTVYSINLLPLGGFVKLKGEHDADRSPGSFGAASTYIKAKIMLAGVVMNLFAAIILFSALAVVGIPKLIDHQFMINRDSHIVQQNVLVDYVEPGSPAQKAGLKTEDTVLSLANGSEIKQIHASHDLRPVTQSFAGQAVNIKLKRNGQNLNITANLRTADEVNASQDSDNPKGYLGIVPVEYLVYRATWSAPLVAIGLCKQITQLTFRGLGTALAHVFHGQGGKAADQVSGPIGIYVILRNGSLLGYRFILMIIAVLSLTLAIMNALPIPALDGGRFFVTLVFRAIKRPLKKSTEEWIHGTGFALLMLLFVLITVVDIRRFW